MEVQVHAFLTLTLDGSNSFHSEHRLRSSPANDLHFHIAKCTASGTKLYYVKQITVSSKIRTSWDTYLPSPPAQF